MNSATPAVPELSASPGFPAWLLEQKLSLALSTHQTGRLYLLGIKSDNTLSVFERSFNSCMGLCTTTNTLYMSSQKQIWRFENVFEPEQQKSAFDRLYVPQTCYLPGDSEISDMAVDRNGRLVFIDTASGCIATLGQTHGFKPLWRPQASMSLATDDSYQLNGLALQDGVPAYVTAVSKSDPGDGRSPVSANRGIVIDVRSNEIVCEGLSMPCSPRWHKGRLWLLDARAGELGCVDLQNKRFLPLCRYPGYARGLDFNGDYALVGFSTPRHKASTRLAHDNPLELHNAEPRCGVEVIDLHSGKTVHWLRFNGIVEELYDLVALPGVRRPMVLGFKA